VIARGMTSSGKRIAALIGLALALLLPKHVECGFPGGECARAGALGLQCRRYELEPLGLFLIELIAKQDVGFAYKSGEDCH
jgi:hypothetical protein